MAPAPNVTMASMPSPSFTAFSLCMSGLHRSCPPDVASSVGAREGWKTGVSAVTGKLQPSFTSTAPQAFGPPRSCSPHCGTSAELYVRFAVRFFRAPPFLRFFRAKNERRELVVDAFVSGTNAICNGDAAPLPER